MNMSGSNRDLRTESMHVIYREIAAPEQYPRDQS